MPKEIVINPVTRIEGHSKITIYLDDQGEVAGCAFSCHAVSRVRKVL